MKGTIITTTIRDGRYILLRQEMHSDIPGVAAQITDMIMDIQERSVRAALIALGWTPPQGDR
jgi:hypothetical protein